MSQSAVWDALRFARLDCVDHPAESAIAMLEAEPDFVYVRCTARGSKSRAIDWLCWRTELRSIDDRSIDWAALGLSPPDNVWIVGTPSGPSDILEVRSQAYGNLVTHRPGYQILKDIP